jgi:hypothetical protein
MVILEKLDVCGPIRFASGETVDPKTGFTGIERIHPAVIVFLNLDDPGRHANAMNGRFTFFNGVSADQHNAKRFRFVDATIHQELVPLFEDVQRQHNLREEHERQREYWNLHESATHLSTGIRSILILLRNSGYVPEIHPSRPVCSTQPECPIHRQAGCGCIN